MPPDLLALVVSYAYVFAVVLLGEVLRKRFRLSTAFTRKFVHVGVGIWIVGTVLLFRSRYLAALPSLTFVALNYIAYRLKIFECVETGEPGNLGTVYFPIAFVVLILVLWERPDLLVASLMPMTWGDAAAAVIGKRKGQHRFQVLGHVRSWEGSAAMLLASWLSVALALCAFSSLSGGTCLGFGLVVGSVAALVEALTPWYLDNLTVSFTSALLLCALLRP